MSHAYESDREFSTGENWDEREVEEIDEPEQAAKDAYFQALLEDEFLRRKFNLKARQIEVANER